MTFRIIRLDDMEGTFSPSASVMPRILRPNCLRRDETNDNSIIPPLQNIPFTNDTVQSVLGNHSSRSNWVYHEVVLVLSRELATELRREIDKMVGRAVRQQLDVLFPAVLKAEIQVLLVLARTDWMLSLKRKMAQMI